MDNESASVGDYIGSVCTKVMAALGSLRDVGNAAIQIKIDKTLQQTYSHITAISKSAFEASQALHLLEKKTVALEREITELNKRIAELTEWKKDSVNYRMKKVGAGSFVYVRQSGEDADAPSHEPEYWLCPRCYDKGEKSVLQDAGIDKTDRIYKCHTPGCGLEVREYVPVTVGVRSARNRERLF
ncbi:hypothetical protein JRC42_19585 [Escherichia albertii]|uniref:hypothetical protein n=1 Tax=Escherichia albertii TaxID=208962 RepID=UPI001ABFA66B|nr:hypothetical protein [Escherichia albertii]QST27742.1 hypothetical protein JRC42_19585 [Escherichia albertii]QST37109.1 hypothetical protein JRC46_19585 [Escherichia albertii]